MDKQQQVTKVNKSFSETMMVKVNEVAIQSGNVLSATDKSYVSDILLTTYKKMVEDNIQPSEINFMGCNFPGQVKRYARLGLSLNESEIYLDIRNNGKTGKKDINIKTQYQGDEKILMKFCQKNGGVVNIIKDVIMNGEELVTRRNFANGNYEVTDHKIPDLLHRGISWENKDNCIGAYAIAYHKDGTQTAVIIDSTRINRAINASASQTKTVWKNDFEKMVRKTAIHDLFKELSKFIVVPDELQEDYREVVLNKDEVQAEVDANANTEVFDADFEVKEETPKTVKVDASTGEVVKETKKEETKTAPDPFGGPLF